MEGAYETALLLSLRGVNAVALHQYAIAGEASAREVESIWCAMMGVTHPLPPPVTTNNVHSIVLPPASNAPPPPAAGQSHGLSASNSQKSLAPVLAPPASLGQAIANWRKLTNKPVRLFVLLL